MTEPAPHQPAAPLAGPSRLLISLLVSLPFALGALGLAWLADSREREFLGGQERYLRGTLTAWAAEADPVVALHRLLAAAERRLLHPGLPLSRKRALLASLHRRFPGLFTFVTLGPDGTPVPGLCDRPQPRLAWQKLDAAYRRLLAGDSGPLQRLEPTAHQLLGAFTPLGRPISGALLRVAPERHRRWLFAGTPQAGGWFLAHLAAARDWAALPLRDRIRRWNRHPRPLRFFLLEGATPGAPPPGLPTTALATLWNSLEPVIRQGETLWGLRRVAPRLTLVAARTLPPRSRRPGPGAPAWSALVLAWLVTLAAAGHPWSARLAGGSSIRVRLVGAVGFAALLPLATIGLVTQVLVREHGRKLAGDLHFRMEGVLRDLDDLAPVLLQGQNETLVREATARSWPTDHRGDWNRHLGRLRRISPWDLAAIYGPGGTRLVTDTASSSLVWSPEDLGVFDKAAFQFLRRLNVPPPSGAPRTPDRPLSYLESTLADIAEQSDRPAEFKIGEERLSLLFIPLLAGGRVTSLLQLTWNRWRLERDFLARHLLAFNRDLVDTRLLVWNPDAPERWFPADSPLWSRLAVLFPAIRDHTGCFQGQVRIDGDLFLVTAIRSEFFAGGFLVAVSSNRFIRTELARSSDLMLGIGLLLAFGSALAAVIFGRAFLHPVTLLGQGIAALQVRDFTFRLPTTGRDELGRLNTAFNEMADGLRNLELTRSVQETLFPRGPLTLPPFTFTGGSTSRSAMGGQAFDYQLREDGKVSFLAVTCRVSGVTAGLALALAKGGLAHPRAASDPAQALADLERTMFPILGGGAPLEMIHGILDPATATVQVAGGSPIPPLLIEEGKAVPVALPVTMPGSEAPPATSLVLRPGAILLILCGGGVAGPSEPPWLALAGPCFLAPGRTPADVAAALARLLEEGTCLPMLPADQQPGEDAAATGWTFLLLTRDPAPAPEGLP
ncbi:MAG: HAMP domain-containing protein [Candidatus Riflebacteria bacterium]|nr:HAMP domain-containing protein [Candidatus Riflebacteria bacterium]